MIAHSLLLSMVLMLGGGPQGDLAQRCRDLLLSANRLAEQGAIGNSAAGDESRRTYEKALSVCQTRDVPSSLRVKSYLGWGMFVGSGGTKGDWEKRAAYFRNAVREIEASDGPNNRDLVGLLDALASTYVARPETIDRAEAIFLRALQIRRTSYGERSTEAAIGLLSLGSLKAAEGKLAEAETLYREAAGIAREACGPRCEALSGTLMGLYDLVKEQPGREAEAEALLTAAMDAVP